MPNQVTAESTKSISLPSQSSTLQATDAMSGDSLNAVMAARIHCRSGRASLLRNATNSPVDLRTPRLQPPVNPRFSADLTSTTSGAAASIRAALSSPDPFSTQTISSSSAGQSTSRRDWIQVMVSSAPRKFTSTTETRPFLR